MLTIRDAWRPLFFHLLWRLFDINQIKHLRWATIDDKKKSYTLYVKSTNWKKYIGNFEPPFNPRQSHSEIVSILLSNPSVTAGVYSVGREGFKRHHFLPFLFSTWIFWLSRLHARPLSTVSTAIHPLISFYVFRHSLSLTVPTEAKEELCSDRLALHGSSMASHGLERGRQWKDLSPGRWLHPGRGRLFWLKTGKERCNIVRSNDRNIERESECADIPDNKTRSSPDFFKTDCGFIHSRKARAWTESCQGHNLLEMVKDP